MQTKARTSAVRTVTGWGDTGGSGGAGLLLGKWYGKEGCLATLTFVQRPETSEGLNTAEHHRKVF